MTTGRTIPIFLKVQVDDGTAMRDLPVNTCSVLGFDVEKVDLSALQDAVKSSLGGQSEVLDITITGPIDNSAAQAASGTGVAPALSGSHTVLSAIATNTYRNVARSVAVYLGIQANWSTGDPVFGGVDDFYLLKYNPNFSDGTYSATFAYRVGTTAPAFGTAAIAAA